MYPYNQSQGWWYIVTNYDRDKHYPGNLNDSLLAGFSNSFIFSFQWTKTWFSATPFVARSSQTNVSRRAWPQSSILVFSNLAKDVSKVDNVVWTTHKVCRCRRWYSRQDLHAHILHYRQLSRRIRPYSVSIFILKAVNCAAYWFGMDTDSNLLPSNFRSERYKRCNRIAVQYWQIWFLSMPRHAKGCLRISIRFKSHLL